MFTRVTNGGSQTQWKPFPVLSATLAPFRISASQLTLYSMCPRKYRYQYVEGRERTEVAAALVFGSAIHAAIEWFVKGAMGPSHTQPDAKSAVRIFKADLAAAAAGPPPIVYKKNDTFDHLVELGEALLPQALQKLEKSRPAAVEEPFEVVIRGEVLDDGTPIHLRGFFDRLEEDGTIVEIKTAAKNYSPRDLAQHLQATAYVLARGLQTHHENGNLHGDLPPVRFLLLLKTRRPEVVWRETRRSQEEIMWFSRFIGETVRAIDRGIYPPRISWACGDCEFRSICYREGVRVEQATASPAHRNGRNSARLNGQRTRVDQPLVHA